MSTQRLYSNQDKFIKLRLTHAKVSNELWKSVISAMHGCVACVRWRRCDAKAKYGVAAWMPAGVRERQEEAYGPVYIVQGTRCG